MNIPEHEILSLKLLLEHITLTSTLRSEYPAGQKYAYRLLERVYDHRNPK